MTEEELKQKCKERAKIFQQAMECCHSSNPMDCIEWFADRIVKLEKRCAKYEMELSKMEKGICDVCKETEKDKRLEKLEKENAELKCLKDVATLIRANNDTVITLMQLNNMLVSKSQQLTKAKNLLQKVADVCGYPNYDIPIELYADIANYLKDSEVEK